MKEEYRVYWTNNRDEIYITVMQRRPLTNLPYLKYQVKGDKDAMGRSFHELKAVLDLVGERRLTTNGVDFGVFADLDKESILAVVPQWDKVI